MQHDFIVGSLLGDATLLPTTAGWCFRVHHGLEQAWYVEHKHAYLRDFVRSAPRRSGRGYYFRTITHPELASYRDSFYVQTRKVVPIELLKRRLTPLGLAIWIMDDGAADGSAIRLNTQSFSYDENLALAELLKVSFELEASVNRDKAGFRLRIGARFRDRLAALVEPYVHPRMRYKLGAPKTKRPLDHF